METVFQEFSFLPEELRLACSDILQPNKDTRAGADAGLCSLIADLISESARHLNIRAGWCWDPKKLLFLESQAIRYQSQSFQTGEKVVEGLRASQTVALFAITCGADFDSWSNRFFEVDDPLSGYLTDALGYAAMDKATELLTAKIDQSLLPLGLARSSPFSPGCSGWPVEENPALTALLSAEFTWLRANADGRQPATSRCGIIGIGEEVRLRPDLFVNDPQLDSDRRRRFLRRISR